jgi:zinc finger FYVE domain-containing protein 26
LLFFPGLRRASSVSSSQSAESPEVIDEADFQIPLKMPARTLDHNVNTISRQLEAAKFLQQCELVDRTTVVTVAAALIKLLVLPGPFNFVPTLFGDNNERILVAALILLCGKNMEEGFGTTFRY